MEPTVLLGRTQDGAPETAAPTVDDRAIARLAARLSGAYVLRVFQSMVDHFGDVRAGLLAQVIHTANTAHLDPGTEAGRRVAGPDGILPDDLRRPISISRLAQSTGLPFESTRRIVRGLVESGYLTRVEGGVITPASTLSGPEQDDRVIAILGYTRKFVRELQAVGLADAAAAAWTQLPKETDEGALARSVARVTAEYWLRALHTLTETYGDIRSGILARTIVIANTAHLDTRLGDGWRYAAIDGPSIPDELRKPISIARLAESLGVAYETMRGQAQRLIDAGVCRRVDGGLIVPEAVFETPAAINAALANVADLRKLVRDLQRFGASLSAGE
jgi:DNA-binding Lrp family transcriptional regulator